MRGLVSLLVFVRHFSLPWQVGLDYGYGYQDNYSLLRLPFARLLYAGPWVNIFFVITGYVLSAKALKLSKQSSWEPLILSLSSSSFRRGGRLFLPPIISTFTVMWLAYFGFFAFPYNEMPGRKPDRPTGLDTVLAQLLQWLNYIANELVNPWRWGVPRHVYGPHLWTIPISFKGSMVTYLTCILLVRTKTNFRLVILTLSVLYTLSRGRWDMATFLGGVLLCELDQRKAVTPGKTYENMDSATVFWMGRLSRVWPLFCLLIGLYVGSFPRSNKHGSACVPGYQLICRISPHYYDWHSMAALMLMWAVGQNEALQQALNLPLMRYFGSISFSMYLIHEPLLHVFGFFTVPFVWQMTGNASVLGYQAGFGLAMVITGFVLIWLADLFKRFICTYLWMRR
ncbi:hypothetical protein GQ53DRAFT_777333 [Thozetella sp. PMI_491]|nr:hypothetical protein GQ53DRAFT_777333 [Thozetella sp. PMI_491]